MGRASAASSLLDALGVESVAPGMSSFVIGSFMSAAATSLSSLKSEPLSAMSQNSSSPTWRKRPCKRVGTFKTARFHDRESRCGQSACGRCSTYRWRSAADTAGLRLPCRELLLAAAGGSDAQVDRYAPVLGVDDVQLYLRQDLLHVIQIDPRTRPQCGWHHRRRPSSDLRCRTLRPSAI